jgi:hypothetical protein
VSTGLHRAYNGDPGILEGVLGNRHVVVERKVWSRDLRTFARLFDGRRIPRVEWLAYIEGRIVGEYRTRREAVAAVRRSFRTAA